MNKCIEGSGRKCQQEQSVTIKIFCNLQLILLNIFLNLTLIKRFFFVRTEKDFGIFYS